MNKNIKLGIVYILKSVPTLNFLPVIPHFFTVKPHYIFPIYKIVYKYIKSIGDIKENILWVFYKFKKKKN